ncbi:IPT/TIG domain-containing protein [Flagellimonas lutaonensis]|uniref:IPT/TIG domain-containing protein n=1 Tax=Flagellimonas lutaonensis TaxID=516051 RepID=A0A0D5YUI7_9FLAO|nr:IPT/TIG domain-containing protein [Allomuricauda lutaonensis]AKA35541.1 hypothetical protein VC82_1936 [Allomuricauda lutaonensis]
MKTPVICLSFMAGMLLLACSKDDAGGQDNPLTDPENQAPVITSIAPEQGKFGTEVTITGKNLGDTPNANTVTFNGVAAIVSSASETQLVVEVPQGAGSGPVVVAVAGKTANGPEFTYLPDNARFVNGTSGTDTDNDCNSFQIPCATIGYGIEQADENDQILIAAGFYTESLVLNKSLILQGMGENETFIQAHTEPDMAEERVIYIMPGNEITIRDLGIRNGKRNTGLSISSDSGGGIYNEGSKLKLINITVNNNVAWRGGGLYSSSSGVMELTDVVFSNNRATTQDAFGIGGAIFNHGAAVFTNVYIEANRADYVAGGLFNLGPATLTNVIFDGNTTYFRGGGMYNIDSPPVLTNVVFVGNRSESTTSFSGGGGMYSGGNESLPVLTNVVFEENAVGGGGGGLRIFSGNARIKNVEFIGNSAGFGGGGMLVGSSSPILTNVLFYDNNSGLGGAMHNSGQSTPTLVNVSLGGNSASILGGGMYNGSGSAPTIFNSIFWGNTSNSDDGNEIANSDTSSARLFYCLFSKGAGDIRTGLGFSSTKSLFVDPRFVDIEEGNLRIQASSVAINAGNPNTGFDFFATDESGTPIDLDGNSRVVDGRIDIGAYEHQND